MSLHALVPGSLEVPGTETCSVLLLCQAHPTFCPGLPWSFCCLDHCPVHLISLPLPGLLPLRVEAHLNWEYLKHILIHASALSNRLFTPQEKVFCPDLTFFPFFLIQALLSLLLYSHWLGLRSQNLVILNEILVSRRLCPTPLSSLPAVRGLRKVCL